ncbi:hydroxymethylglutaryl-CoA lyase [Humitalea sp. 24SJ18S-53]|uniref:hydroxymethylglutaryl-CoA lyase n=1 Tax=Humitalea sp. 24SJ18S-53 TaxID=3422307 RepID=UPI003D67A5D5
MPDLPRRIKIFEEGPREGFQFEKGPIPTEAKIRLIDALSDTGLRHIQIASFVDPRRVPGMADAEAVARGIRVRPGVEYSALWMNERGLRQALDIPHLRVDGKVRLYPSGSFLRSNLQRTPEENRAKNVALIQTCLAIGVPVTEASISSAFGCNFEGDIPLPSVLAMVEEALQLFTEHGCTLHHLILADTMAWATPLSVQRMIGAIRTRHPDLPLRLHLHDTRGMGLANAFAGLAMGIDLFDASIAGLGGCPFAKHRAAAGNVCTEDLVSMCHEMGIDTGTNLEALVTASEIAQQVVGHPLPGRVAQAGSLSAIREKRRAA